MNIEILQLFCVLHYVVADSFLDRIPEDGRLNFTQLAVKYGQKCEEYDVITEDKYILKLFHIEGDKTRPVLVSHGNMDSSDSFIIRGNTSLAVVLGKEGYDLWFLNVRGNKYSRHHETLNPDKDAAFWDFSYHDIGLKDLPANIDFVLKKTNQKQLIYIGHSQGTEISFVLTSLKREYNDKFKVHIAMAPAAFVHNTEGPVSSVYQFWPGLKLFFDMTNTHELFGGNPAETKAYQTACLMKDIGYEICCKKGICDADTGTEIEPEFFNIVVGHFPTSTSTKNYNHMSQNHNSKRFSQYDYGVLKNLELYGSPDAPNYPLENITATVVLIAGSNDKLADPKDVNILRSRLSNVCYHIFEGKGHLDFVWGKDMKDFLFPLILKLLKDYN